MNLQEIIEKQLEKSEQFDRFLDKKVEEYLQKKCLKVLELKRCVNWGRKMQTQNSKISRIIINVEENKESVSQVDTLQIMIAALDDKNNPIRKKGEEVLAVVLFAGTIDKEMIDFLNGAKKRIYRL